MMFSLWYQLTLFSFWSWLPRIWAGVGSNKMFDVVSALITLIFANFIKPTLNRVSVKQYFRGMG